MCGLAGFLGATAAEAAESGLRAAIAALRHRGPDGDGTWFDAEAGIGFAHARLSILELSDAGAQPMQSGCGRMVLVHNGEIYNHHEVRGALRAAGCMREFRGDSDTETLVEACALWGVEAAVRRCRGLFAFAVWDRRERTLYLVRDPLGIKPLYWGDAGTRLLFGSEIKGLLALGAGRPEIDPEALREYFRLGYVPAPRSIYRGIRKLAPGEMLICRAGRVPESRRYWSMREVIAQPRDVHPAAAPEALEQLLQEVVREQLISDVPVGALLSGGIDSSLVTAMIQRVSTQPARTFSIGFAEQSHDESAHAAEVARYLGTEHTELRVMPEQALAVIPELPLVYDEPFADSSQIPTLLLARLTRRHVTVALSGDGGDETFAGYNRHVWANLLIPPLKLAPLPVRRGLAAVLEGLGPRHWEAFANLLPAGARPRQFADKVDKLANVLRGGADECYARLLSVWHDADAYRRVGECGAAHAIVDAGTGASGLKDAGERMQLLDTIGYLPDDILTKVDRATMAVALECRVPLLDPRVIEFAWRLPWSLRVRGLTGKWIARKVLERHVPRRLFDRPKSGFSIPLADWLRGGLRDWAESMLSPAQLEKSGVLDPAPVQVLWREHLAARRNRQHALWNVLMFQAWHDQWR